MKTRALAAGGVAGAAFVIFVGWLVQSCLTAKSVSRTFLAAVRENRLADARAIAGPGLDLGKVSTTLAMVRTSNGDDLGVVQTGFGGTYPLEPFACFDGKTSEEKRFFIVTRKLPEGWRVVELSDVEPEVCKGSE